MSDYPSTQELPLFELATRAAPVRSESAKARQDSRNNQLLIELVGNGWVSMHRLIDKVGHRFSTNVNVLRNRGHVIEKRGTDGGAFEYRYVTFYKKVGVTEDWQAKYLASPHWREKRRERLEFDSYRCCDCHGTENLHVHHWRYDLFAERLRDLMTLCKDCHKRLHDNDKIKIHFPKHIEESIFNRL